MPFFEPGSSLLPELTSTIQSALLYALLPVAAIILGGIIAIFRAPGPGLQSAIQHFAGGVVFAAVAVELLPEVMKMHSRLPVIIGFALGVALMLAVRWFTARLQPPEAGADTATAATLVPQTRQDAGGALRAQQKLIALPIGLLVAVGIDLTLDGLLVGVAFAAGAGTGVLITIALTLEVVFLSLSTAVQVRKAVSAPGPVLAVIFGLAMLLAIGAVVGITLLGGLSGPPLAIVLSFGLAALLYLVTEELLVEAHEVPETMLATAMFFAGFLALMMISIFAEG